MKSRLYSLLEQGILKKPKKVLITYRSLITPANADTSIGLFTLWGVKSNDDPTVQLSDEINLYASTDPTYPYRTVTVDIDPQFEITNIFFTLGNDDNDYNINIIIDHIEIITEQGTIPIGIGILEPVATAATLQTATGFTANWTGITEATGYKLDVAEDIEFTTYLSGYEDKDVGLVTTYAVTDTDENKCYYYRVRAVNSDDVESRNSNEIHVQAFHASLEDALEDARYFLLGTQTAKSTIAFEEGCVRIYGLGIDYDGCNFNTWYVKTLPWMNNFKITYEIKQDGIKGRDMYVMRTSGGTVDTDTYVCHSGESSNVRVTYEMAGATTTKLFNGLMAYNNTWESVEVSFIDGIATITTALGSGTMSYTPAPCTPSTLKLLGSASSYNLNADVRFRNIRLHFQINGEWKEYTYLKCDDYENSLIYSVIAIRDYRKQNP